MNNNNQVSQKPRSKLSKIVTIGSAVIIFALMNRIFVIMTGVILAIIVSQNNVSDSELIKDMDAVIQIVAFLIAFYLAKKFYTKFSRSYKK